MSSVSHERAGRPLTHRDLDDTPDDGSRWEVIDGILHVTPFPSVAHQRAATRLTSLLDVYVRAAGVGEVFTAGLKVVLDEPSGVGPDVVFVATARLDGLRDDGFYGAPDLVVEVLSSKPGLDRFVKFQKYATAGVVHYWIVDPVGRELTAYRLEAGQFRLVAEVRGAATFQPELFPGLSIALSELWMP